MKQDIKHKIVTHIVSDMQLDRVFYLTILYHKALKSVLHVPLHVGATPDHIWLAWHVLVPPPFSSYPGSQVYVATPGN